MRVDSIFWIVLMSADYYCSVLMLMEEGKPPSTIPSPNTSQNLLD